MRFIADEEVAYVAARSREVHDLWHVLFRCPTTVLGELALKGMEFVQVLIDSLNSMTVHLRLIDAVRMTDHAISSYKLNTRRCG